MELDTSVAARATPGGKGWNPTAINLLSTIIRCDVDDTFNHRTEHQYLFRVLNGAVRKCLLTADGRRQIVDFLLPGDVSGFGARDDYDFSMETISAGTTIARYPRRALEDLTESDREVSRWVREMAFNSISRLQTRTLILGHTSAVARVAAFLLEWSDRCEPPEDSISLPMSRYDIADYLAMAVETVSRAFTSLRTRRVIAFRGTRDFSICSRHALELTTEGGDAAPVN